MHRFAELLATARGGLGWSVAIGIVLIVVTVLAFFQGAKSAQTPSFPLGDGGALANDPAPRSSEIEPPPVA